MNREELAVEAMNRVVERFIAHGPIVIATGVYKEVWEALGANPVEKVPVNFQGEAMQRVLGSLVEILNGVAAEILDDNTRDKLMFHFSGAMEAWEERAQAIYDGTSV